MADLLPSSSSLRTTAENPFEFVDQWHLSDIDLLPCGRKVKELGTVDLWKFHLPP